MNEITLGKNIAELRKAAGFTQEQLASQLGLTYQAVSKWENKQSCPDVMLLPQLADCFGVSIDTLFGRENTLILSAATPEQEEILLTSQFPWPDDETLYAVLFKGHTPLTDEPLPYTGERECIRFIYTGPALNVSSHFNITCENCEIHGDINASGNIDCGDVTGDVSAGGDVDCGNIGGSVRAGADISCGDVGGSVNAGCEVSCGDVKGNVTAGMSVDCGDIGGNSTSGFPDDAGKVHRKPHVSVHLVNDDDTEVRELRKEFDLSFSQLGDDLRGLASDIKNLFKK